MPPVSSPDAAGKLRQRLLSVDEGEGAGGASIAPASQARLGREYILIALYLAVAAPGQAASQSSGGWPAC